ncbi:hypothetical protein IID62_07775 [candidate division KSB1 bacterium]|nr:hypothetical protein [candidate division KSB1 bacterium]
MHLSLNRESDILCQIIVLLEMAQRDGDSLYERYPYHLRANRDIVPIVKSIRVGLRAVKKFVMSLAKRAAESIATAETQPIIQSKTK